MPAEQGGAKLEPGSDAWKQQVVGTMGKISEEWKKGDSRNPRTIWDLTAELTRIEAFDPKLKGDQLRERAFTPMARDDPRILQLAEDLLQNTDNPAELAIHIRVAEEGYGWKDLPAVLEAEERLKASLPIRTLPPEVTSQRPGILDRFKQGAGSLVRAVKRKERAMINEKSPQAIRAEDLLMDAITNRRYDHIFHIAGGLLNPELTAAIGNFIERQLSTDPGLAAYAEARLRASDLLNEAPAVKADLRVARSLGLNRPENQRLNALIDQLSKRYPESPNEGQPATTNLPSNPTAPPAAALIPDEQARMAAERQKIAEAIPVINPMNYTQELTPVTHTGSTKVYYVGGPNGKSVVKFADTQDTLGRLHDEVATMKKAVKSDGTMAGRLPRLEAILQDPGIDHPRGIQLERIFGQSLQNISLQRLTPEVVGKTPRLQFLRDLIEAYEATGIIHGDLFSLNSYLRAKREGRVEIDLNEDNVFIESNTNSLRMIDFGLLPDNVITIPNFPKWELQAAVEFLLLGRSERKPTTSGSLPSNPELQAIGQKLFDELETATSFEQIKEAVLRYTS